jgi:hypothetical protein
MTHAITIRPAISQTSRVIRACPSPGCCLCHLETFGVDPLGRHIEVDQSRLGGVHHRIGSADEVLKTAVAIGQMACENLGRDVSDLTGPAIGGPLEHMNDGQVEPVLEFVELLAKRHPIPFSVGVEEDHGPNVVAVGHRAQRADQARDSHPTGEQSEAGSLVLVDREHAVRPVDVHRRPRLERVHRRGEVTERLDRDLDPVALSA